MARARKTIYAILVTVFVGSVGYIGNKLGGGPVFFAAAAAASLLGCIGLVAQEVIDQLSEK